MYRRYQEEVAAREEAAAAAAGGGGDGDGMSLFLDDGMSVAGSTMSSPTTTMTVSLGNFSGVTASRSAAAVCVELVERLRDGSGIGAETDDGVGGMSRRGTTMTDTSTAMSSGGEKLTQIEKQKILFDLSNLLANVQAVEAVCRAGGVVAVGAYLNDKSAQVWLCLGWCGGGFLPGERLIMSC